MSTRYCWHLGKVHVDVHFWWVCPNFDPDFQHVPFRGDTIIAPLQRGPGNHFWQNGGSNSWQEGKGRDQFEYRLVDVRLAFPCYNSVKEYTWCTHKTGVFILT